MTENVLFGLLYMGLNRIQFACVPPVVSFYAFCPVGEMRERLQESYYK